jgi:phosphotransferase system  glucose/maltose/N-acetylglucosamine-specific IIC component
MAIASLVSALAGLLCMIGSVLGVVFGIIALNQIKNTGQPGRGMALAGIIIGGVTAALTVVIFFFVIIVGNTAEHERTYDSSGPAVIVSVAPSG